MKPYADRGDSNLKEKRSMLHYANLMWLLKMLLGD